MLLTGLLNSVVGHPGPVVVLTGAGISAESGIPTFRGPEGYWRVGSRNYQPTEMATAAAFDRMPEEVWRWYLHRRRICRAAAPNAAHQALVELESALTDRFLLVTQNVDGLHLRAGNSQARTFEIHGNIDFCRCQAGCPPAVRSLPDAVDAVVELRCRCGAWLRPHVLWFDECYDEPLFRYDSTLAAARSAAILVVVGTSGATSLPAQMCQVAAARGIPLVVVDPAPTPFAELARASGRGAFVTGTACAVVPELTRALVAAIVGSE